MLVDYLQGSTFEVIPGDLKKLELTEVNTSINATTTTSSSQMSNQ